MAEIKAYVLSVLMLVMLVVAGLQTFRLHGAQLREAGAITALADARTAAAEGSQRAEAVVRETQEMLQTAAAQTRKETNATVNALATQRDALLRRVRVAEANAATAMLVPQAAAVTCTGEAAPGNPGAELLGSIGQADVEEASRADILRIHLKSCYEHYDNAVRLFKAIKQ